MICEKELFEYSATSSGQFMQWSKLLFLSSIDELQKNSAVQRMIQETYTVCFIDKIVSILQKVPGINMYVFFLIHNLQWWTKLFWQGLLYVCSKMAFVKRAWWTVKVLPHLSSLAQVSNEILHDHVPQGVSEIRQVVDMLKVLFFFR